MAKVICMLPNASTSINGVGFVAHELGMLSEEIEQDRADGFLKIKGYQNHVPLKVDTAGAADPAAGTAASSQKATPKKR